MRAVRCREGGGCERAATTRVTWASTMGYGAQCHHGLQNPRVQAQCAQARTPFKLGAIGCGKMRCGRASFHPSLPFSS